MSTRVQRTLSYDAPLADVAAMLVDLAFRERVLAHQKVDRGSAAVEGGVVTLEQVRSAEHVPAFARKLVGPDITIRQREAWTSREHADITMTIPGKPGDINGTATLTETGGRTVETVNLEVSIRVPLVGGKIEGLVASLLGRALDKEHEVGVAWLAES